MERETFFEKKDSPIEREQAERDLQELGLDFDDLAGKRTLDIGSGMGQIGKAATAAGFDVISVDLEPHAFFAAEKMNNGFWPEGVPYGSAHHDEAFQATLATVKEEPLDTPKLVVADANQLPFGDNTFDLVVSYAGPINYTGISSEERTKLFAEALRVLTPGGEIRFGPKWKQETLEELGLNLIHGLQAHSVDTKEGKQVTYYSFTK